MAALLRSMRRRNWANSGGDRNDNDVTFRNHGQRHKSIGSGCCCWLIFYIFNYFKDPTR